MLNNALGPLKIIVTQFVKQKTKSASPGSGLISHSLHLHKTASIFSYLDAVIITVLSCLSRGDE